MKIQPPAGPPAGPTAELEPGAKPEGAPGSSFASKLESAGKTEAVQQPEKTAAAEASRAAGAQASAPTMAAHLEAVSREMAAGLITTREQAIQHLVGRLLDAKFEGKLPPDSMAKMKAAVAAEVAADPHLSERIDRLLAASR